MDGQQVAGEWLTELEARARAHVDSLDPTASESDRLVHELQVHRIELEMQNEELIRSHEALEKTCERYRAVLAAAPLGYLALDAAGCIREVNPQGARLLGGQAAELIDRHLQAFLCVADADRLHIRLSDCLSTAIPQTFFVAVAREDSPAQVRLHIVPSPNGDGIGPPAWVFMLELSQFVDDCATPRTGAPHADVSLLAARALAKEATGEGATAPGEHATSERVVLVVDDDKTVLRAVSRMLRLEGYQVVAASSGAEALEIARTKDQRLDLLLSDVRMPGMHGGELGQHMASIRPLMPRIYMSGDIGDVVLEPGATLLAKPFRPDNLVRLLKQRLSGV